MTAGAVLVAGILDTVLREPPLALHPVRAAGRNAALRLARRTGWALTAACAVLAEARHRHWKGRS